MNGQLLQACGITVAAKQALKSGKALVYVPQGYENRIEFQFLQRKNLFGIKKRPSANVPAWYKYCMKNGLLDIALLVPVEVSDRNLLGFSNTSQSSIVCFFKLSAATCFSANWQFDSVQRVWNVIYTEYEWSGAPRTKPRFENNTASFASVLSDIRKLADRIDCSHFAKVFQKAHDTLLGCSEDSSYPMLLPVLPDENIRLFQAACIADVFGAMGSWNDDPAGLAFDKGMAEEYEMLSTALLKQVRLATLFAINEW